MADNSSASTMIVAIVAIIVIVLLALLLYRAIPMNQTTLPTGTNVQLNLPTGGSSSY